MEETIKDKREYKAFLRMLNSKARWSEIERVIGQRNIVIFCGYDLDEIKRNIKNKVRGNIRSRYVPRYKKLIAEGLNV